MKQDTQNYFDQIKKKSTASFNELKKALKVELQAPNHSNNVFTVQMKTLSSSDQILVAFNESA